MLRLLIWGTISLSALRAGEEPMCPPTAHELQRRADAHLRHGRFGEAERLSRACVAQWEKTQPPGNAELLNARSYLGLVVLLSGRIQESEALLKQAYALAREHGDSASQGAAAAYLGSFYRYQRDTARALPLLRMAQKLMAEGLGPDAAMVGSVLMEIGAVRATDGKFWQAEEAFGEALRIMRLRGLESEVRIGEVYLGAVQVEQGRMTEAEPRLRKALANEGDDSAVAATTRALALYHLARMYRAQNRNGEAESTYRAAIASYEQAAVQPFPQLGEVVTEYALFLKKQRHPEAHAWAARAKAFRAK